MFLCYNTCMNNFRVGSVYVREFASTIITMKILERKSNSYFCETTTKNTTTKSWVTRAILQSAPWERLA